MFQLPPAKLRLLWQKVISQKWGDLDFFLAVGCFQYQVIEDISMLAEVMQEALQAY